MTGEISVSITVDGHDPDEQQQLVLDVYEETAELFIYKNLNYSGSFENSAKIESLLRNGEVKQEDLFDIVARQIFVRGFLDKMTRFYQLQFTEETDRVGEDIYDTLQDLGNYAFMLASLYVKYEGHPDEDLR